MEKIKFNKYTERGAYHWKRVSGPYENRSIPMFLRFKLALNKLSNSIIVNSNLSTLKGLDAGCGEGVFMSYVLAEGGYIDGIDLEQEAISLASSLLKGYEGRYNLIHGSCYNIPVPDCTYDYVVSLELIEHLPDGDRLLKELYRVLKPGGKLVLTTPYGKPGIVYDEKYHFKEYNSGELKDALENFFINVQVEGMIQTKSKRRWRKTKKLSRPIRKIINYLWFFLFKIDLYRSYIFNRESGLVDESKWENLVAVATKPTQTA